MNKVIQIVVSMGFMALYAQLHADRQVMGPATYTDKTVDEPLTIMGPLTATGLTATKKITVYGPADLTNSKIDELVTMGPLTVHSTIVKGSVQANGNIRAKNSTFEGPLRSSGRNLQVILEDTKTEDITLDLEKTDVPAREGGGFFFFFGTQKDEYGPRVVLKGKTTIDGNLTFLGDIGTVEKDDAALITGVILGEQEK